MSMATGKVEYRENLIRRIVGGVDTAKLTYTIDVPNGSSHFLIINSNAPGNRAIIYVGATSGGIIMRDSIDVVGYTITNGTGSITITIDGTTTRPIFILDLRIRGDWVSVS